MCFLAHGSRLLSQISKPKCKRWTEQEVTMKLKVSILTFEFSTAPIRNLGARRDGAIPSDLVVNGQAQLSRLAALADSGAKKSIAEGSHQSSQDPPAQLPVLLTNSTREVMQVRDHQLHLLNSTSHRCDANGSLQRHFLGVRNRNQKMLVKQRLSAQRAAHWSFQCPLCLFLISKDSARYWKSSCAEIVPLPSCCSLAHRKRRSQGKTARKESKKRFVVSVNLEQFLVALSQPCL